jgi:formamidopyrimidine-DNA glycosylase
MPELPEVQTTVNGLSEVLPKKKIVEIWNSYNSPYFYGKENIKDRKYFLKFKKSVLNSPILSVERKGKNILINLKNKITILVHMKMTGHFLYGNYKFHKNSWVAVDEGPLKDPFNRHIRLVFKLSDGKYLAFSDMRKFAKVMYIKSSDLDKHPDIKSVAPDPLCITKKEFIERLRQKKSGRIKNILMDQGLVSGIGNIYSDETLFRTNVHPESDVRAISDKKLGEMWLESCKVLEKGIDFGGDSTSDYRNIHGERGAFQNKHEVYRKTGLKCPKKGCGGKIERKIVGGRSAHFCNKHQKLLKTVLKK